MRADEVDGVGRLARLTLRGGTDRVHEVHQGIAARAFRAVGPAGRPVEVVHDAVSGLTYSAVRLALGAGARAVGGVASLRADGRDLDAGRPGRVALAILNGAHGDLLQREAPALALDMTVRVDGRAVPPEAAALRDAFPQAARERQGACQLDRIGSGVRRICCAWVARAERDAVTSAVLGVVQTAVRTFQEPIQGRAMIGCERAADGDREVEGGALVGDRRIADGETEALRSPDELIRGADAGQKDRELLAAPARQAVPGLEDGPEPVGEVDQDGVTHGVAVGVVDLLEMIGI